MCHSARRLPPSCTDGESSASAASGSLTTGRSSYSTSTSSQATASASSVSAITNAIGSPWKRTRSVASTCMLRLERADRDGLTGHVDPDLVVRHVLAEQHRDDAGHRGRGGDVAPGQQRARHLRAHETRVQHAREREIARVPRRAGDLLGLVVTRERLMDDAKLLELGGVDLAGHRVMPCVCASSIASTIVV